MLKDVGARRARPSDHDAPSLHVEAFIATLRALEHTPMQTSILRENRVRAQPPVSQTPGSEAQGIACSSCVTDRSALAGRFGAPL